MNGSAINNPVVNKVWSTPNPKRVIALAGRMTYSKQNVEELSEGLTEKEIDQTTRAILERRHLSVLRHVDYCFTISGVSRAFSHQLVRHTAGHSFEQRSQHYREEGQFNYIVPETINGAPALIEQYYEEAMNELQHRYDNLVLLGIPKEDARFVLPNACETQLIWTANLEAILNFIKTRACSVNTDEIKKVALLVRKIVLQDIPEMKMFLGPPCLTTGMCFEGKKYFTHCNRPWKDAVLWTPEFPKTVQIISNNKAKEVVTNVIPD